MKILHTSDWHLGKSLSGFSRFDEQKLFLEELVVIADEENADAVIVAGDVFDTYYPQPHAEKLFYYYAKKLTKAGQRPLIVIAGNHDQPERLSAANPLSMDSGIIIVESAQTVVPMGRCGQFDVVCSEEGYFELSLNGGALSVITLPYISEKRVNKLLSDKGGESEIKDATNRFVAETLQRLSGRLDPSVPAVAVGHFYLFGGSAGDSERGIQFGGSSAVAPDIFPESIHYVAMGHLHKPQKISARTNVYYSGSPLSYALSEASVTKKVFLAEINPPETRVYQRLLSCPLPFMEFRGTVDEVVNGLKSRQGDFYAFIDIVSETPLTAQERADIFAAHSRIAEITISHSGEEQRMPEMSDSSFADEFRAYFEWRNGTCPPDEIMRVFMEIAGGDENDETC